MEVISQIIKENGNFPNNDRLPIVMYKKVFDGSTASLVDEIKQTFSQNGWQGIWVNGVYDHHHYHSSAHEALGVCQGEIRIELGGEKGQIHHLQKGDVVILPAGMAHKNLYASSDFICIGAYPQGQEYDMMYGKPEERQIAYERIRQVPMPITDPVFGTEGRLLQVWREQKGNY